jgi:hypothetical protein
LIDSVIDNLIRDHDNLIALSVHPSFLGNQDFRFKRQVYICRCFRAFEGKG